MDVRAAVAVQAGKPLEVMTYNSKASGRRGADRGQRLPASATRTTSRCRVPIRKVCFRRSLAMRVLASSLTSVRASLGEKGDHVIRFTRQSAGECYSCLSRKTNLCTAIRSTQGQGLMPDGTSRFSIGKDKIHHYMAARPLPTSPCCRRSPSLRSTRTPPSTRSATSAAASRRALARSSTRLRSRWARPRSSSDWCIGLNVIQGLRLAGADMIIRRRHQSGPQGMGREIWHDPLRQSEGGWRRYRVLPRQHDEARCRQIGGADYTFDCTAIPR